MKILTIDSPTSPIKLVEAEESKAVKRLVMCPSCGHSFDVQHEGGINRLPMGMKFDPNDQEILEHLEAMSMADGGRLHPLIDDFIPTLEDENGICYTHPEMLPGMSKDGHICHFFHRPSKAYTTGTRKRRKVQKDKNGNETRWHKTGKTRPLLIGGMIKGYKKILVLYTNYGRQRKPEKTNWVMHQYHLGSDEDEKEGELVLSKVFYQTQPRQCGASIKDSLECIASSKSGASPITMDHYNFQEEPNGLSPNSTNRLQFGLIPNTTKLQDDDNRCTYIRFASNSSKGKLGSNRQEDATFE